MPQAARGDQLLDLRRHRRRQAHRYRRQGLPVDHTRWILAIRLIDLVAVLLVGWPDRSAI